MTMTVNGQAQTYVKCGDCDRAAAIILPDGSVQVQSRHGGANHHTVIPARLIVNHLPISAGLKRQLLSELST